MVQELVATRGITGSPIGKDFQEGLHAMSDVPTRLQDIPYCLYSLDGRSIKPSSATIDTPMQIMQAGSSFKARTMTTSSSSSSSSIQSSIVFINESNKTTLVPFSEIEITLTDKLVQIFGVTNVANIAMMLGTRTPSEVFEYLSQQNNHGVSTTGEIGFKTNTISERVNNTQQSNMSNTKGSNKGAMRKQRFSRVPMAVRKNVTRKEYQACSHEGLCSKGNPDCCCTENDMFCDK